MTAVSSRGTSPVTSPVTEHAAPEPRDIQRRLAAGTEADRGAAIAVDHGQRLQRRQRRLQPSPQQREDNGLEPDESMYGLYEGIPRTDYGADWAASPNRITLFRLPLEEDFPNRRELEDEVRVTVLHELAHHLGIDDDRLDELGAG